MDKLKSNRFLAAMGALFVVAILAFAILVYPAWNAAGTKTKAIKDNAVKINMVLKDLPGDPNVKDWQEHAGSLRARYGKTLQQLLADDKALGQWFDELDDNSTIAVFMNKYDDEKKKLQDDLVEKGVQLGSPKIEDNKFVETRLPGFNWIQGSDITRAKSMEDDRLAKEILQKRFNICRAVVNAVSANYVKDALRPRRLLDVTFLERFPYAPATPPGVGDVKVLFSINIEPKRYAGHSGMGGHFSEQALPSNGDDPPPPAEGSTAPDKPKVYLGKTLTFGFAVVMEYSQVPDLIRNLIQPSVEPVLNLSIVGLNIFVPEPNPAEKTEIVNVQKGEDTEPIKKKFDQMTADCPPPQVHVYVTCQVHDLDPAAVPAYLKP